MRPRGWHLVEEHLHDRRRADLRRAVRFRPLFLPQRQDADRGRARARISICRSSRRIEEARLWNDVFVLAQERLGIPQRHDQGDRADRDPAGRVRDGRDPVRAARPHRRAQCRALGLYLLVHQEARQQRTILPARPQPGGDGRGLPRRLCGAAGEDLPPPRRLRDGRHGGADPGQERPGGERRRLRQGARRQGARSARRP